MCSRGVYQLRKINLQFCDQGGSSKGIREFLQSDTVKEFMIKNPQIQFEFIMRRNKHPFFNAQYINGFNKDISLKNYGCDEILKELDRVRTSFGRKALPFAGKKLYTSRPSIQGKWTPTTWNTYPRVEMQMLRETKEPTDQIQLVDNINKNVEMVNYKDFVHAFLKEKKINEEFNSQNI